MPVFDGVMLSEDTARRMVAATRVIESMGLALPRLPAGFRPGAPGIMFKVTTQITASVDDDTPGFGFGTMRDFNPATGKLVNLANSPQWVGIKIWSISDYAIKVGATVQCLSMYGQWWYDVTKCANGITPTG